MTSTAPAPPPPKSNRAFITAAPAPAAQALPPNKSLSKRPLLHPPLPAPTSRGQRIVYVSARTPFVSACKRVSAHLDTLSSFSSSTSSSSGAFNPKKKRKFGALKEGGGGGGAGGGGGGVEGVGEDAVVIKATGRAIEKALQLGVFFQGKERHRVVVRTGTVDVVDDVVDAPEGRERGGKGKGRKRRRRAGKEGGEGEVEKGEGEAMQVDSAEGESRDEATAVNKEGEGKDGDDSDLEMLTRKTSMVEIWISRVAPKR